MRWRLVISDPADGPSNMALDEAIMLQSASTPTLRLYSWSPPCLSLGYSQSAVEDVDLEACARLGIGLVRRPTGGGAILHDLELTYAVVAREEHPSVSGGILESYRKISQCLVSAMAHLGLYCELSPKVRMKRPASSACFMSPSTYELTAVGRKLVGSAQLRRDGAVLQHGSLPLEMDRQRILRLLRLPAAEKYDTGAGRFLARATSLSEALARTVCIEEAREAVISGFEDGMNVEFEVRKPTQNEMKFAEELRQKKYDNPEWTMKR